MSTQTNHANVRRTAGGTAPLFPIHPNGLLGWKTRRACRKAGGHWWHPSDAMVEWRCCNCGATTDGNPKDGSRHPKMVPVGVK